MKKSFVLDTNVLLHDKNSLFSFADNTVIIPIDVLEELDNFKNENTELGRNARGVIRALDELREKGNLQNGVKVKDTGGSVIVDFDTAPFADFPLSLEIPDNRIIASAYKIQKKGKRVVFISKDINARVKADALGIKAMDFEKEKVDIRTLYPGWREVHVPRSEIDSLTKRVKTIKLDVQTYPNEYVVLRASEDEHKTLLVRTYGTPGEVSKLKKTPPSVMGIAPRNKQQVMAYDLLLDDNILLVALVGQAGTGKTLLALAAGLSKVMKEECYDRLLVSRPIMPLGKDIGYLPGSKSEKLESWMQPIFDNMTYILQASKEQTQSKRPKRVEDLIQSRILDLEPLTYMRGRSIPNQFIIVDEAQNLTPHEVKTIISRAGQGSKLVLTGDPYQIDNPYLDSASNGLSYTIERMKNQKIFGSVLLVRSERSELASIAAQVL
ncbi:MAG: PhoH family protein [Planctomycetota bacterium]